MLSIQNNKAWQTLSLSINNAEYEIPKNETVRKTIFLLVKLMESVYFRLWDLVTQSKYKEVKKAKMKTELKRITIGTVEKCLVVISVVPQAKIMEEISAIFMDVNNHFHTKINQYADYAIEEAEMKPYFTESAFEIVELEFEKLKRRLEHDDFDFTKRPGKAIH